MVATQTSLTGFLTQNRTQFVIPVYQMNYAWMEIQYYQHWSIFGFYNNTMKTNTF